MAAAKSKKKVTWKETLLWVVLGILILAFLYQLLKLWQAGLATASGALSAVGTALQNTVAAGTNFLTGLITAPSGAISALLGGVPDLLSFLTSFLTSFLSGGDFLSAFTNFFGSLFSQGIAAVSAPPAGSAGNGSSFAPTPAGDVGASLGTSSVGSGFGAQITGN